MLKVFIEQTTTLHRRRFTNQYKRSTLFLCFAVLMLCASSILQKHKARAQHCSRITCTRLSTCAVNSARHHTKRLVCTLCRKRIVAKRCRINAGTVLHQWLLFKHERSIWITGSLVFLVLEVHHSPLAYITHSKTGVHLLSPLHTNYSEYSDSDRIGNSKKILFTIFHYLPILQSSSVRQHILITDKRIKNPNIFYAYSLQQHHKVYSFVYKKCKRRREQHYHFENLFLAISLPTRQTNIQT